MNAIRGFLAISLACAALGPLSACASECSPTVREGWVRLPPMAMPMTAGFGRIENRCPAPVTIVGVSSPAFAETSLHETRIVDGVSRMRAVAELQVDPGQSVVLEPGGLHLMLMRPHAPLQAGSRIVIEFALKDGGTLRGELVVRKPGE